MPTINAGHHNLHGSGWPTQSRPSSIKATEDAADAMNVDVLSEPFALRYLNRLHWRAERPFEKGR